LIKIISVHIEKFRGIKCLDFNFNKANFVVNGSNGSGKSGVIDALEFALTGDVSRLSGTGTAGISVGMHAAHVDFRDNKKKVKVSIKISNKNTGNVFTIERSVATCNNPKITPNNEESQSIISFLKEHPEFSLSRREILKFIVTEPSKRAKEVQALLKMDSIDKIRAVLKKLDNDTKNAVKEKESARETAKNNLLIHLGIQTININEILEKTNKCRHTLGLKKLIEINSNTEFDSGIKDLKENIKSQVQKEPLCKRINDLFKVLNMRNDELDTKTKKDNESLIAQTEAAEQEAYIEVIKAINSVSDRPEILKYINKQKLYEDGLALIIDDICPLCDTEFDLNKLKKHIQRKIDENKEAICLRDIINSGCCRIRTELSSLLREIGEIKRAAPFLGLQKENEDLIKLAERLQADSELTAKPFNNLGALLKIFKNPYERFNEDVIKILRLMLSEAQKIPDSSATEKARRFLTLLGERFAVYIKARLIEKTWVKRKSITSKLLSRYEQVTKEKLEKLYNDVEKDFSSFYSSINDEDEQDFRAKLIPSKGSLDLCVDFYGRGKFPPNAFHSEGHQDGMGLCLYLALAKRVMGANFTFCLLDDVLMSVDANHRRNFCKLLKEFFPSTQFLLTTHDKVWVKQLISEKIVGTKQVVTFRKWSVENGPSILCGQDIKSEIDNYLKDNNITEAAPTLRRYLEYILAELGIKLRAKVELTNSSSYDLGELLPAVISQYNSCLKKAKNAANHWGRKEMLQKVSSIANAFSEAYQKTQAEQWSLNPAIHFNAWENFEINDFIPIKEAFFNLLEQFKCPNCSGWIYVSPIKGKVESVRCDCGAFSLNVKS